MCHRCIYQDLAKAGTAAATKSAKESAARRVSAERAVYLMNLAAANAYCPDDKTDPARLAAAEEMGAKTIAIEVQQAREDTPFQDESSFLFGVAYGIAVGLRHGSAVGDLAQKKFLKSILEGLGNDKDGVSGNGPGPHHEGRPRA